MNAKNYGEFYAEFTTKHCGDAEEITGLSFFRAIMMV